MLEKGWDVELTEDGVITAEFPAEQTDRFQADSKLCLEAAGIDVGAPATEEQLATAYRWYSDIAECLTDKGFDVPPRPSEAAFKDSYNEDPWVPWNLLAEEEMQAAFDSCPVMEG